VTVDPLLERFGDSAAFRAKVEEPGAAQRLGTAETTGRPFGGDDFVWDLERRFGESSLAATRLRRRAYRARTMWVACSLAWCSVTR
jgi:hypothetical protein